MLMTFRPEHFKPKRPERPERPERPRLTPATLQVGAALIRWGAGLVIAQQSRRNQLESSLLELAGRRLGVLTVSDAVRELGASWGDCEAVLSRLARKGCCYLSARGAYIFEDCLPRIWSCEYCDGAHLEGPICPNCGARLVERPCQVAAGTGRDAKTAPSEKGWPCW